MANILTNRYYVGVVTYTGVEYPGAHQPLISEALFQQAQAVRQGRASSRDKPRIHTHYLKGSLFCGQCGEPLTFERTRNRQGAYYEYFYCIGRQRYRNGCTFRALPVALAETLIEDHWSTITIPASKEMATYGDAATERRQWDRTGKDQSPPLVVSGLQHTVAHAEGPRSRPIRPGHATSLTIPVNQAFLLGSSTRAHGHSWTTWIRDGGRGGPATKENDRLDR